MRPSFKSLPQILPTISPPKNHITSKKRPTVSPPGFPVSLSITPIFSTLHTQTHQRPLQFSLHNLIIMISQTTFGDHLLSSFLSFLCTLLINILFPLPGSCKDTALSVHNRKHSANTGCGPSATVFHYHTCFAHSKGSTVITVSGKDSQITADSSADHTLHITFKEQSVRCSDSQRESTHRTFPPLLILGFFKHFIDGSHKQEITLRNVITLTVQNHPESSQCLLQRNIFARHTCKLFCYRETL